RHVVTGGGALDLVVVGSQPAQFVDDDGAVPGILAADPLHAGDQWYRNAALNQLAILRRLDWADIESHLWPHDDVRAAAVQLGGLGPERAYGKVGICVQVDFTDVGLRHAHAQVRRGLLRFLDEHDAPEAVGAAG